MAGLDSVGGFLNGYVKENPKAFLTLFCDKSSPLNVQGMKSLLLGAVYFTGNLTSIRL